MLLQRIGSMVRILLKQVCYRMIPSIRRKVCADKATLVLNQESSKNVTFASERPDSLTYAPAMRYCSS